MFWLLTNWIIILNLKSIETRQRASHFLDVARVSMECNPFSKPQIREEIYRRSFSFYTAIYNKELGAL